MTLKATNKASVAVDASERFLKKSKAFSISTFSFQREKRTFETFYLDTVTSEI